MTDAAADTYDFSPPAPAQQRKLEIATSNSSGTVWSHSTQSLDSSQALRMLDVGGPSHFIAYCSVVRFLRQHLRVLSQRSFIVLATVPPNWQPDILQAAAKHALTPTNVMVTSYPDSGRRRDSDDEAIALLKRSRVLVFCSESWEPDPRLQIAVTQRLRIEVGSSEQFRSLSRLTNCGNLSDDLIEEIASAPSDYLDGVFRRNASATAAISRLRAVRPVSAPSRILPLHTNKGFGPASAWSRELHRDLQEYRLGKIPWADVDKGALLYGPPGTGKTSFALALARECDLHLVATSHAEWQGSKDGHLGSLLAAMRRSFAQAKNNAPSLLFIDELDSLGCRNDFTEYRDYQIQVVNGLLQAIDGIDGREGVIVLGACNDPNRVDPALTRSGRLERKIHFPLPDAETRLDILKHYFPSLSGDEMLPSVAGRLAGCTGADIERLSREARRAARASKRGVSMDDVIALLPSMSIPDEDDLFRVAVHEAGHAMLAAHLEVGTVVAVEIYDFENSFPPEGANWGRTVTRVQASGGFRSRGSMSDNIAMLLGGMIAEEIVFGDRTTSAGGSNESDLHSATRMATEMISMYGFGDSLAFNPGAVSEFDKGHLWRDTISRNQVNAVLSREHQRANQILSSSRPLLLAVALAIKANGRLLGSDLAKLMQPSEEPQEMFNA